LLTIGRAAYLRSGTVIYAGSRIGDRFQTGHHVVVREETAVGDDVSIWSNSVVDYGCLIGDRVKIHSNCYIAQFSELENDVFLAPGVTLANDLYPGSSESAAAMAGPLIRQGAHIGVNVTILPCVTIGPGAIVGAGSVVTKSLPGHMVAYGCPAVPVRPVPEADVVAERVGRARAARFPMGVSMGADLPLVRPRAK
jgi:acetyltransferase-like isoleucine patch superfamily enzyme